MSASGQPARYLAVSRKGRLRRAAVVAGHPGDCLLSDPAADPPGGRLSRQPMPTPAVRDARRDRLKWVDSGRSERAELTGTGR